MSVLEFSFSPVSNNYPKLMLKLPDHPKQLYTSGSPQSLQMTLLAVVGTRKMTSYGKFVVRELIPQLVAAGFGIVSGLAFGVDAEAHQATIDCCGKTIAVLPGGLDMITPPSHTGLAQCIVESGGCLLSEHPAGTPTMKHQYILRNRIIAGMSQATLVIEAGEKSGALITAHWAAEYGRPVFAIPGPINNPYSEGTKKLINEGATLVTSVEDILEEFSMLFPKSIVPKEIRAFQSVDQEHIYHAIALAQTGLAFEELQRDTGLPISVIQAEITLLEMQSAIQKIGSRFFVKT